MKQFCFISVLSNKLDGRIQLKKQETNYEWLSTNVTSNAPNIINVYLSPYVGEHLVWGVRSRGGGGVTPQLGPYFPHLVDRNAVYIKENKRVCKWRKLVQSSWSRSLYFRQHSSQVETEVMLIQLACKQCSYSLVRGYIYWPCLNLLFQFFD